MPRNLIKKTKFIERSKKDNKPYNPAFCNGIKSKKILFSKFQDLKAMVNITNTSIKPIIKPIINIIPYCGEFVHVSKYLDKVNESAIELEVKTAIETTFNVQIITNFINEGMTETYRQYRSISDATKFKKLLESHDTRAKILNDKKHALIVVHGNIFKQFTELYGNRTSFDNLDILQIIIHKDNSEKPLLYARRFNESYSIATPLNTEIQYKKKLLKGCTNIFLMRHCVACHNIINKIGKSKMLGHIMKKIKSELGYSLYSICSPYTITELMNKKQALLDLFDSTCDGIHNIQFGSSVIFRAILTAVLFARILNS